MKINMPVTQREIELEDGDLIVSRTDLKGQIVYVNPDFIRISGFTEDELIGQSHNIVRHPDMPVEAFEDLWRDLKNGRPWSGVVKNRCKNGDHYWVEAHVTPVIENGSVTGYMSIRRKASIAKVKEAEAAYAQFRGGKAGGMQIANGRVRSSGLVTRLATGLKDMSLATRAALAATLVLVVILGLGSWFVRDRAGQALEGQGLTVKD